MNDISVAAEIVMILLIVIVAIAIIWGFFIAPNIDSQKHHADDLPPNAIMGEYTLATVVSGSPMGYGGGGQWSYVVTFKENPSAYWSVTSKLQYLEQGKKYIVKQVNGTYGIYGLQRVPAAEVE